jgi:pyruvate dehydrogenase E1 component alpha subunit
MVLCMHTSKEKLIQFYEKMLTIRRFEERACKLFTKGALSGWIHPGIGQEAVPVGVCSQLKRDDYIVITHRGHGHAIAKGATLKRVMAELFGKETGLCKGRGGSMHLIDGNLGIISSSIVGSQIPLAAGVGLSIKLRGGKQVVVSFFGDGASNTGAFHEGLNLASIWRLPVIFVCENNLYAISTHVANSTSVKNIADRGIAYNIPSMVVDGNDVIDVYNVAGKVIEKARNGGGPSLIECKTYRWRGHAEGDEWELYRSEEEVKEWMKKCPIERLKAKLIEIDPGITETLTKIEEKVLSEIEEAVKFADESPYPLRADISKYVYVEG